MRFLAPPGLLSDRVQLVLNDGPEGISIKEVVPARTGADLVLECNASKVVKPGLVGNLIVNVMWAGQGGGQKKKQAARPPVIGTLPAIPFAVVAR